jgi:hypothetical protein
VLETVGAVVLAGLRPFAMSLYDTLTHGARFFVLYLSSCVSISAGMTFTLPTKLIGNVVKYLKCTSQSSHAPNASNTASKMFRMLSTVSVLLY